MAVGTSLEDRTRRWLPGSLATPTLLVDRARLEDNLVTMAQHARDIGVALRPHAKTHKCIEIARRQLALGARGLTVSTVGEAEVFADAGFDDLFIAYPVWAGGNAHRLVQLSRRVRLRVGVDSADGCNALAAALGTSRPGPRLVGSPTLAGPGGRRLAPPVEVLVEIDSGHHRSGVLPEQAGDVAVAAARAGLEVAGVFTFPGHAYGKGAPPIAANDEATALDIAAVQLATRGIEVRVRSGGSTPTTAYTHPNTLDELRPGVYVGYDAQQLQLGTCSLDQVAFYVMATVVSVPAPWRFVLDSGSKILGADRPSWMPCSGFVIGPGTKLTSISQLSEHHAVVTLTREDLDRGATAPVVGQRMAVLPNHLCTAVNLADELIVVEDESEVDRWPVAARGRNT
jgi:D-serine deaminase-like pyridoxal phosphate-dependent protein